MTACAQCGHTHTHVTDSRRGHSFVKRRRECAACGHRYTTFELLASDIEQYKRFIQDTEAHARDLAALRAVQG